MRDRLKLHNRLSEILETNFLYYQQPENFKLQYPCAIYKQEPGNVKKASNTLYGYIKKYSVTYISTVDRDDLMLEMLSSFDFCTLENVFINDNLYHYTFTIYY